MSRGSTAAAMGAYVYPTTRLATGRPLLSKPTMSVGLNVASGGGAS